MTYKTLTSSLAYGSLSASIHAITVLLPLCLFSVSGCSSDATRDSPSANQEKPEVTAIRQVISEDVRLKRQLEELNTTPHTPGKSELKDWAPEYVKQMSSIDLTSCPADFREAYLKHLQAWRDLVSWLPALRIDGIADTAWVLLTEDIPTESKKYNERVVTTWQEVELIALKYGVQVPAIEVRPFAVR